MKQTLRTLTDRWMESLRSFEMRVFPAIPDQDGIRKLIDEMIVNVAMSVAMIPGELNKLDSYALYEEKLKVIREQYAGLFGHGSGTENLTQIYLCMQDDRARLLDLRRQEDWASFWDHARTLFFRAATTVMIAAVVMSMGYLSQKWQIPLPMFRGLV